VFPKLGISYKLKKDLAGSDKRSHSLQDLI